MRHTLLFFSLLLCLPIGAQQTFRARVVDAETGEALPFARVNTSENRATLSNRDGYFTIVGTEEDVLTVSFVGYEKKSVKAGSLPATIRLKPMTMEMGEIVVRPLPVKEILSRIRKKLHEERFRNMHKMSLYFFRSLIKRTDGTNEMLEGFYSAFSHINIKGLNVISGQTHIEGNDSTRPLLNTNFHKLFSLAPVIYDESLWEQALQPLGDSKAQQKAFDADITSMHDEDGRHIYKIKFLFNGKSPIRWDGKTLIQGTLYVDAKTYGLLHFDGQLLGMEQKFNGELMAMDLTFHVDYTHERGFTEVAHISFDGGNHVLSYHCLLFMVDKMRMPTERSITRNLVVGILNTGYDASLWEKYDIIQRTEEEERIAQDGVEKIEK